MTSPNRIVIIHDTDQDGCCAAWLVRAMTDDNFSSAMTEEQIYNDNYLFIPMRSSDNYDITDQLKVNDRVVIVDRSFPVQCLKDIAACVKNVTLIDHHCTAIKMYNEEYSNHTMECISYGYQENRYLLVRISNITLYLDINYSGCGLVLKFVAEYLQTKYADKSAYNKNISIPWFVEYVEDRDLWRHKLPYTKELNNYIGMSKPTVMLFHNLAREWASSETVSVTNNCYKPSVPKPALQKGIAITEYKDGITKHIAESSSIEYIRVDNFTTNIDLGPVITIAVLQCPYMFISDVGDYLLSNEPQTSNPKPDVVMVYNPIFEPEYAINSKEVYNGDYGFTADIRGSFVGSEQQGYVYSLRSKHGVSDYAKGNGGGGHPTACGFKSPLPPAILLQPLFR